MGPAAPRRAPVRCISDVEAPGGVGPLGRLRPRPRQASPAMADAWLGGPLLPSRAGVATSCWSEGGPVGLALAAVATAPSSSTRCGHSGVDGEGPIGVSPATASPLFRPAPTRRDGGCFRRWLVQVLLCCSGLVAMMFALLPSLRLRERDAVIRVRVCRKWEFRGGTDHGSIIHVDLVLIDEKGNSMYAEIPTKEIERKSHLVEEGKIYIISRFRVSNTKDTFMPVPGNYMIEFSYHTLVNPVVENAVAIPEFVYHLTPFSQLEQRVGDQSRFTDVIGILVDVSDTKVMHLTGKPAPTVTRDIILCDLTHYEIKVTLWGHRATSFNVDAVYDPNELKPVVVLLVGTIVKSYRDQPYLSANAACRWYFNPPIPEASTFYSSLDGQQMEINRSVPAVDQPKGPPLAQAEIATLTDLDAIDPYTIGDNCYRSTVVVDRLVPGERWWFPSCARCNKSCLVEGSGYRCRLCSSTTPKFKYKLAFVATDGTTEAQMIAFADVAARIVGKPVQQLMRAGRPKEDFPPDIAAVVSMRFTFVIMLAEQSFAQREKSYRVLSVLSSHGRQIPGPRSVITACTSQTHPHIGSHQQQDTLEGENLEPSAQTAVPTANAAQQTTQSVPQTASETVRIAALPSQHTPASSNVQATPSDTNKAALSEKMHIAKTSAAKNTRVAARRKLVLSKETAPEETADSASGAKKQRAQRTTAAVQIKERPAQSLISSTPDDGVVAADATSDTNLE